MSDEQRTAKAKPECRHLVSIDTLPPFCGTCGAEDPWSHSADSQALLRDHAAGLSSISEAAFGASDHPPPAGVSRQAGTIPRPASPPPLSPWVATARLSNWTCPTCQAYVVAGVQHSHDAPDAARDWLQRIADLANAAHAARASSEACPHHPTCDGFPECGHEPVASRSGEARLAADEQPTFRRLARNTIAGFVDGEDVEWYERAIVAVQAACRSAYERGLNRESAPRPGGGARATMPGTDPNASVARLARAKLFWARWRSLPHSETRDADCDRLLADAFEDVLLEERRESREEGPWIRGHNEGWSDRDEMLLEHLDEMIASAEKERGPVLSRGPYLSALDDVRATLFEQEKKQ